MRRLLSEILLGAGFDVYETVADDQGIDGIIRIEKRGKVKYYDFQSKGSKILQALDVKPLN